MPKQLSEEEVRRLLKEHVRRLPELEYPGIDTHELAGGRVMLVFAGGGVLFASIAEAKRHYDSAMAQVTSPGPRRVATATGSGERGVRALSMATGIPEAFIAQMEGYGRNLRRLEGSDPKGERVLAMGVTIDVPYGEAQSTVRHLQDIAPPGCFPFVSVQSFGVGGDPDQVSVMRAADSYEIMRAMGTNGVNHGIETDAVIVRLKEWAARYGLVFRGIGFDWLEAEFLNPPEDMLAFAKEVYEFCPDVVDQGTRTVAALAAEMKQSESVYLWWD